MAAELRRSDFEPLDFELDFSDAREMPPVELGGGEDSLVLSGIADRVDGWYHDGKLYLRVVDYKTGRKEFSMSDVWYGMGLQMLLYLFALEANGGGRYDCEVLPAGVMYVPARSRILSMPRDADEESVSAERAKEQRCRALRASRPAYKKDPCGHGKAAASGQHRRRPVLPRPAGERLPELRLF